MVEQDLLTGICALTASQATGPDVPTTTFPIGRHASSREACWSMYSNSNHGLLLATPFERVLVGVKAHLEVRDPNEDLHVFPGLATRWRQAQGLNHQTSDQGTVIATHRIHVVLQGLCVAMEWRNFPPQHKDHLRVEGSHGLSIKLPTESVRRQDLLDLRRETRRHQHLLSLLVALVPECREQCNNFLRIPRINMFGREPTPDGPRNYDALAVMPVQVQEGAGLGLRGYVLQDAKSEHPIKPPTGGQDLDQVMPSERRSFGWAQSLALDRVVKHWKARVEGVRVVIDSQGVEAPIRKQPCDAPRA
mmetsp:Transcript_3262/g.10882  ORF Transcript_3262/g.10882 Transcript_3262/m.10882 type:complete len:305 (+) Transcript_3262:1280-2194(+)